MGHSDRRNLVLDLQDAAATVKHLIRHGDTKFPTLFDEVLADAGIAVLFTGIPMPRMNARMECWARNCRRELFNRALIWNHVHLLRVLCEFESHDKGHRPHRALRQAASLHRAPESITGQARIIQLGIRRHDRLSGLLHEYVHAA